ncbi:MAG: hypothetical protein WEB06_12605 [Actinomycetota bacterium]
MERQSQGEGRARKRRGRPRKPIEIIPSYASLPEEEEKEVIKMLADLIRRAYERRQAEK